MHFCMHSFEHLFVFLIVLLWCCRFLRHVPVVYVDYPGQISLTQIYGTFNRAMLRLVPSLKPYAEPLTNAMVEFYLMSQVTIKEQLDPWLNFKWLITKQSSLQNDMYLCIHCDPDNVCTLYNR